MDTSAAAHVKGFTIGEIAKQTRLSKAWWAVVSRFLLHGLVVATWVSRIPAIQETLKLNNAQLGLCLLGTAIGSVAGVAVAGWLVARFGSKQVTTWSTAAFCLAMIGPSLATNAATLFAALIIYGAMAGANDVSINSQAVAVEAATRTPTMSRFHAMFSIGGMLGAGLGGWLAGQDVSPRLHFAIASLIFLGISALGARHLLETHEHAEAPTDGATFKRIPRVIVMLAVLGLCLFLSEGAMADWAGVYLKQALLAKPAAAAAGYAVFSAGMATFRLLGDLITKRLGAVLTVRIGALVAACGLTAALLTCSIGWALFGFLLTGAGYSVIVPLTFGASGRVKGIPQGAGIALVSGAGYAAFLLGPPLIGGLAGLFTLRAALFLLVGLSLLAVWLANAVQSAPQD
jgi:MFS family permease